MPEGPTDHRCLPAPGNPGSPVQHEAEGMHTHATSSFCAWFSGAVECSAGSRIPRGVGSCRPSSLAARRRMFFEVIGQVKKGGDAHRMQLASRQRRGNRHLRRLYGAHMRVLGRVSGKLHRLRPRERRATLPRGTYRLHTVPIGSTRLLL